MIREKSAPSIETFYMNAELLLKSKKTREHDLLKPILVSRNQITEILSRVNKFTLDVTLSSLYVLCDLWYKKRSKKLNIYQDNSKQIEHYREIIEFTKNLDLPAQEIGFGSRKMIFPTQIEKLE
jgi:hypothetical protein